MRVAPSIGFFTNSLVSAFTPEQIVSCGSMLTDLRHVFLHVSDSIPLIDYLVIDDDGTPELQTFLASRVSTDERSVIDLAHTAAIIQKKIPFLYIALGQCASGLKTDYTYEQLVAAYTAYGKFVINRLTIDIRDTMNQLVDEFESLSDSGEDEDIPDLVSHNPKDFPVHMRNWLPPEGKDVLFYAYLNHGVAEHSGRYDEFARAIAELGGSVFCQDHKGHGLTADKDDLPLGQFDVPNPMQAIIEDSKRIIELTNRERLPWVLFGHSMGTLVAQGVLERMQSDESAELLATLKGVVLSGPPSLPGKFERVCNLIILTIMSCLGCGQWLLRQMTFRKYDRMIRRKVGVAYTMDNEWLNRDFDAIRLKASDPYSCQPMSFAFWKSLSSFSGEVLNSSFKLTKNCAVLLVGGDMDAATNFGKSLHACYDKLQSHTGARSIDKMLIGDERHELLASPCKEFVIETLSTWMSDVCSYEGRSSTDGAIISGSKEAEECISAEPNDPSE